MIHFLAMIVCLIIGGYGVATRNAFLHGAGGFAAGSFFHAFLMSIPT